MIEAVDLDYADIAVARRGDGRFEDKGALQIQLALLCGAGRRDPDRDRRADRAPQPIDDFAMHTAMRRDPVDRDDLVFRSDPGAFGRTLRFDGGDAENVLGTVDGDPDPAPAIA